MTLSLLSLACVDATRQLGNHLWQSTLFAGAAALIALALRKHQARVRYWLWMAASLKFLIPLALLIALGSHLGKPSHSVQSHAGMYAAVDEMSQPFTAVTAFSAPAVPAATQQTVRRSPVAWVPLLLAIAWLFGFIAVLGYWCVQWRRIAKAVKEAQPLLDGRELEVLHRIELKVKTPRRIEILSSRGSLEPGVIGIVQPVLLWPEGISSHLDDAHLEAVLAHEVCHVQRRDNLTSVIHMLVEAIFWFYPLVWWMERRLVEERERACDESVLKICSRPQVYAESLVKVCEFCVESPMACISGITGADLKRRIGQIMTDSIARKLGLGARLLLLAVGLAAISAPIMLGQMKAARVVAAVKASVHAATGAISFAGRVMSPIETESTAPSNTLIALQPVHEFQLKPVELAQAGAAEAGKASGSAQTGQTSSEIDHAPFGWGLSGSKPQNYRTGIDPEMTRNGLPSAYLASKLQDTGGFGTLSQQAIKAIEYAGKRIRLRAWVRSNNVTDWAGLWMTINRGQTVVGFDNMQQRAIHGSQPWMTYDVVLDVPEDATQIAFGLLLSGPGEVWLNDVKLEAVGQDVPTTGVGYTQNALPTTPVNLNFRTVAPQKQSSASFGVLNGKFPVKDAAGKTVRFSAWIKTENVLNGYAGLWWRVDGPGEGNNRPMLAFDNSMARVVGGVPDNGNGIFRGATGTTPWTLYEFELPVDKTASNINFGVLLTGTGTAWVDSMKVELDGEPYSNPQFDFDFESSAVKGFYAGCGGYAGCTDYKAGMDDTTYHTGSQSLKMQYVGDAGTQK